MKLLELTFAEESRSIDADGCLTITILLSQEIFPRRGMTIHLHVWLGIRDVDFSSLGVVKAELAAQSSLLLSSVTLSLTVQRSAKVGAPG